MSRREANRREANGATAREELKLRITKPCLKFFFFFNFNLMRCGMAGDDQTSLLLSQEGSVNALND